MPVKIYLDKGKVSETPEYIDYKDIKELKVEFTYCL